MYFYHSFGLDYFNKYFNKNITTDFSILIQFNFLSNCFI
jgi:hypothetical protein